MGSKFFEGHPADEDDWDEVNDCEQDGDRRDLQIVTPCDDPVPQKVEEFEQTHDAQGQRMHYFHVLYLDRVLVDFICILLHLKNVQIVCFVKEN